MSKRGFPVVLSAASGTGKTTLANLLLDADSNLRRSVSTTTRPLRGDERDGVDYHFVDQKRFQSMIDADVFVEWAEVHGNRYGSSSDATRVVINEGRDVLFDIDVQGGEQLKKLFPESCLIFILPPSFRVLEERLRGRGTDEEEVIAQRLEAAKSEMERGIEAYDYVVVNDRLDTALSDLRSIVRVHRIMQQDRNKLFQEVLSKKGAAKR